MRTFKPTDSKIYFFLSFSLAS